MKWLDEAQEFVWMDAKQIGGRIYHASCHAEVSKDASSTQVKRGTPDPVLGKRKAEVSDTETLFLQHYINKMLGASYGPADQDQNRTDLIVSPTYFALSTGRVV